MEKYALKKFGQNFLQDENILKKIINVVDIKNKNVLEIGPGEGALTKYLVKYANEVVSIEIDHNLNNFLQTEFKDVKNLKIINQDFLKMNLNDYYKDFIIVANIPYNISTDIIFKIFENHNLFNDVVLLVQKEFGKRVCAQLKSSDYGKLSITTKIFYHANYCFDVPNKAFFPVPKVTSGVIHLSHNFFLDDDNKSWKFANFIKTCFMMKRKTLINNLKTTYKDTNKIINVFELMKINKNVRAEELSIEQFYKLFLEIEE